MAARRPDSLSLRQLLPNLVTIIGLCAGLTAIRYVLLGRADVAASLILLSAVMDALDGLLARRLDAASNFGAEIDSLSDFVCFGVAPGLVIYQTALSDVHGIGWVFVLVYIVCACLRLARFNVDRDLPPAASARPQFIGVPAPGGALLALMPVFLSQIGFPVLRDAPMICGVYIAAVGLLMIGRMATPSIKAVHVPRDKAGFVLIGVAVVVGFAFTRFWMLLAAASLAYLGVVAWSVWRHLRSTRP